LSGRYFSAISRTPFHHEGQEGKMHINSEITLDFVEARLDKTLELQWSGHLESCSECSTKMNDWRRFCELLKPSRLESAPSWMLASAVALFQPQGRVEARRSIRQVIATLFYDSFAQPAFAGARGTTATRQVVLRAEKFDVHMRIWMTGESRELLGQIQPRDTAAFVESARLHLLKDGKRVRSAETNALGEFHFSYVPDGSLDLQIDLPHLTVIGILDITESI
jgi:hypothetical protein